MSEQSVSGIVTATEPLSVSATAGLSRSSSGHPKVPPMGVTRHRSPSGHSGRPQVPVGRSVTILQLHLSPPAARRLSAAAARALRSAAAARSADAKRAGEATGNGFTAAPPPCGQLTSMRPPRACLCLSAALLCRAATGYLAGSGSRLVVGCMGCETRLEAGLESAGPQNAFGCSCGRLR